MRAASDDASRHRQFRIYEQEIPAPGACGSSQLNLKAVAQDEGKAMLDRTKASAINVKDLPDSLEAVNDYFYEQGLTDGLPIVPPTLERVERMLSGMSWREPDSI